MRSLHVEMDNISREATTFRLLFFQENQFPSLGGPTPVLPCGVYKLGSTPVLPTGIWGGFDGNVFDENNIRAHYLTTNAKTEEEMIQRCHAFYTTQSFRNNGFVVSVEHKCCSSLHWLLPTCTERCPVLHVLLKHRLSEADAVEDARLEEILSRFNCVVHKALREAHESRRGNDDWGNESQNECEVMAWYTMFALREASSLNIQEFLVGEANAFEDGRLEALLHCFKDFVHDALRKAHAKRRNEPVKYAWGDQSAATDEAFYDDVMRAEGLAPGM